MTDRELLLRRIQVCDFALNDAALFLDVNPDSQPALEYHRKYLALREQAAAEYNQTYGPLAQTDSSGGTRWNWVDGPWPWQLEEEA